MRIRDIINEAASGSLQPDVAASLPATYVIPKLQNQDPYRQYRFGVAIARAKSQKSANNDTVDYEPSSAWGENQVIVSYSNTIDEYIDAALQEIGLSPADKRLISTPRSEETATVNRQSPVPARRPNRYGV